MTNGNQVEAANQSGSGNYESKIRSPRPTFGLYATGRFRDQPEFKMPRR